VGKIVKFERPDGKETSGYLSEPKNADACGIVVIQEWWGLNDQIKGVAERLTAAGYRALVPDLYRGSVAVEAKEAEHLMTGLNFADAASQDIAGAVQHLKDTGSSKVALMGFCMGGALTVLSSVFVQNADVAVVWYGVPPIDYVNANAIKIPVLGHFAAEDAFFPRSQVEALEGKFREANVTYQFHWYNATHAFANDQIPDPNLPVLYDAEAANLAWGRTMDFLGARIGKVMGAQS
jgi:carboxymethylenebutenolidase